MPPAVCLFSLEKFFVCYPIKQILLGPSQPNLYDNIPKIRLPIIPNRPYDQLVAF